MNAVLEHGGERHAALYRPRFFGWKPFMRRTGALAGRFHSPACRQDARIHPIQPGLDILTYWLDENIGGGGTGPCLSLYCRGFEILRFDCFGKDLGHYHISAFTPWRKRVRRFWFAETTARGQIERALFELSHNLKCYLRMNPRFGVRGMKIDRQAVAAACAQAREALLSYLEDQRLSFLTAED